MQTWLIFVLFLVSGITQANITPPYPEVWGYDLSSYPVFQNQRSSIDAYRLTDNDIGFLFLIDYSGNTSLSEKAINESQKHMLRHFFTGEKEYFSYEKSSIFIEEMRNREIPHSFEGIVASFKDGSYLKHIVNNPPKMCLLPFFLQTELEKKNNTKEKNYLILGSYNTSYAKQDRALCDICSAPFFYTNLYNLAEKIIDLGDDTLIVYSRGGNLILRVDKNLQTKFKPETISKLYGDKKIDRNFFIVDYDEVMDKYTSTQDKTKLPYYQTINDNLLIWLQKEYPNTMLSELRHE